MAVNRDVVIDLVPHSIPKTGFDNPLFITHNGYRLLMNSDLIGSRGNDKLVLQCFAWRDKDSPLFMAFPGNGPAIRYRVGEALPDDIIDRCTITRSNCDPEFVLQEYIKAMLVLCEAVHGL